MTAEEFDAIYRSGGPPWDIGGPQPAFAAVLDSAVRGPKVLDIGCGTGDLAIALAHRGFAVTAVDVSAVAIAEARRRAGRAGVTVDFAVQDATTLSLPAAPFDTVVDSGLLHVLHRRRDGTAEAYLALLPGLTAPGGAVFVLAVSAAAGGTWSLTEPTLRSCFAPPAWQDTRIEAIDVAASVEGRALALPGFLVRTTRATGG